MYTVFFLAIPIHLYETVSYMDSIQTNIDR